MENRALDNAIEHENQEGKPPMKSKNRWKDLSPARRAVLVGLAAVQLLLQGIALRDLAARGQHRINGSKKLWVAATFINFAGPLGYLRWGRKQP